MNRLWMVTWREKHEQGDYDAQQLVWCEDPTDAVKLVQMDDVCPTKNPKWKTREFMESEWDQKAPLERACILKRNLDAEDGDFPLDVCNDTDIAAIRERWKEQREFAAHPKLLEV